MHSITRFLNYLKHKDFSMALGGGHLSSRDVTEWYTDWIYEAMETEEVRTQPYHDTIRETVSGKVVLELGTGRRALLAISCAQAGAKRVYAIEANKRAYEASVRFVKSMVSGHGPNYAA
jgi:predicted RNA methylase